MFCDVLKANGYEVVPVADGQNVLATAQRFAPDLVIMDIQLPNVSGIDLIAQLKADNDLNGVPVLAVTAYAGKGDEERIRDAGAADYLAKPVSIGPFMTAVRTLLPA
nr:response regulator [Qipengyuania flava]